MSNALCSSFCLYSASNVCGTGPYTAKTQYQMCQVMGLIRLVKKQCNIVVNCIPLSLNCLYLEESHHYIKISLQAHQCQFYHYTFWITYHTFSARAQPGQWGRLRRKPLQRQTSTLPIPGSSQQSSVWSWYGTLKIGNKITLRNYITFIKLMLLSIYTICAYNKNSLTNRYEH